MVSVGSLCAPAGWRARVQRRQRCAVRLFQWGGRTLAPVFNAELPIPVQCHVTIEQKKVYGGEIAVMNRMTPTTMMEALCVIFIVESLLFIMG